MPFICPNCGNQSGDWPGCTHCGWKPTDPLEPESMRKAPILLGGGRTWTHFCQSQKERVELDVETCPDCGERQALPGFWDHQCQALEGPMNMREGEMCPLCGITQEDFARREPSAGT